MRHSIAKCCIASIVIISVAFISCKKSSSSSSNNINPACTDCEGIQANASVDASQKGVYKGAMLTSQGIGHFRLNYENGNSQTFLMFKYTRNGYAVLVDSVKPVATIVPSSVTQFTMNSGSASVLANIATPPAYASVGNFTLSGGIGTGAKPESQMLKETSTEEVKVYEGTVTLTGSTGDNGKVAFVIKGNSLEGLIATSNGYKESFNHLTIGSDKKFSVTYSGNNSVYAGELVSDNSINGTVTVAGTQIATFVANRSY